MRTPEAALVLHAPANNRDTAEFSWRTTLVVIRGAARRDVMATRAAGLSGINDCSYSRTRATPPLLACQCCRGAQFQFNCPEPSGRSSDREIRAQATEHAPLSARDMHATVERSTSLPGSRDEAARLGAPLGSDCQPEALVLRLAIPIFLGEIAARRRAMWRRQATHTNKVGSAYQRPTFLV